MVGAGSSSFWPPRRRRRSIENGWVKPGAHVMSVGACRPRPARNGPRARAARAAQFVDSRAAALVESGDVVMGIQEGRFAADHIRARDRRAGRPFQRTPAGMKPITGVTIFKVARPGRGGRDRRRPRVSAAVERGIGRELELCQVKYDARSQKCRTPMLSSARDFLSSRRLFARRVFASIRRLDRLAEQARGQPDRVPPTSGKSG